MDVCSPQAGGNIRVLQVREQAIIKRLIGFEFPLEQIVLDQQLIDFFDFNILLCHGVRESFLPLDSRLVFAANILHCPLSFPGDERVPNPSIDPEPPAALG